MQMFSWNCLPKQRRSGFQLDGARLTLLVVFVPIPKLSLDSVLIVNEVEAAKCAILPEFNGPGVVQPRSFQVFSELGKLKLEPLLTAIYCHHILFPP